MKKHNLIKFAAALCLSAVCLLFPASDVDAKYVEDTKNGVSYNNEYYITSNYASAYSYGSAGYVFVDFTKDGYYLKNVKSKSKNLIAKKVYEYKYSHTSNDYDFDKDKYTKPTTTTTSYAYIGFYAKKKGNYKVTFDVYNKKNKKVCTKTIKVYVDKPYTGSSGSYYTAPIKSIKYAGKESWEHYPYAKKTKGTIKVSMNKGYTLKGVYVEKQNSKGEWKRKRVKNGDKIELAQKTVYTGYNYKSDLLFPETRVVIKYYDKKAKQTRETYEYYYTLNKKSNM